jgi:3-dehydroquinate dehydratase
MKTKIFQTITIDDIEYIISKIKSYPFIELRLDHILHLDFKFIFSKTNNNEIISTMQINKKNKQRAIDLLIYMIDLGATSVDINIESLNYSEIDNLIQYSKIKNCNTILSIHNFNGIFSEKEIEIFINQKNQKKLNFIKIVVNPTNDKEYNDFKKWYNIFDNVIFLCTGKYSLASRLYAIERCVPFVYSLADGSNPLFDGHIYYSELVKYL